MKYRKNSNQLTPAVLTAYWFIIGFILTLLQIATPQSGGISEGILAVSYVALGLSSSLWFVPIFRRCPATWMKVFVAAGYGISSLIAYFVTIYSMFFLEVFSRDTPGYIRAYLEAPAVILVTGNITLAVGTLIFFGAVWLVWLAIHLGMRAVRLALKKN